MRQLGWQLYRNLLKDAAYLSPCNIGEWVSFCLTRYDQLSTSLLPVLPSRNHQKFGWVLSNAKHHVILMQIDDIIKVNKEKAA